MGTHFLVTGFLSLGLKGFNMKAMKNLTICAAAAAMLLALHGCGTLAMSPVMMISMAGSVVGGIANGAVMGGSTLGIIRNAAVGDSAGSGTGKLNGQSRNAPVSKDTRIRKGG